MEQQPRPDKGGRPAYEPTGKDRRTVEAMAGYRIAQLNIARVIGVSDVTLRKYFREELDVGMIKADVQVVESLHKAAREGNVTAQIWWTKTQCGWQDKIIQEHQGRVTFKMDFGSGES